MTIHPAVTRVLAEADRQYDRAFATHETDPAAAERAAAMAHVLDNAAAPIMAMTTPIEEN